MPATPGNSLNITAAGIVVFDGTSAFTADTVTQHDVLVGGASNAITSVAPSATSGVPLISQGAAADPVFGTAAIAGGGTNATSFTQTNGILTYNGTSLVNYAGPQLSSAGVYTNTSQPAFFATHTADQNNVTGAGATVTVNFTSEVFDQANNYDGTNTFTAPVTGKYYFEVAVFFTDLGVLNTTGDINIITTANTFTFRINPGALETAANSVSMTGSCFCPMTATDTCHVTAVISGGAGNTVDIPGSSTTTFFSGYLVC